MSFFSGLTEAINDIQDTGKDITNFGKGLVDDMTSLFTGAYNALAAEVTTIFDGDIVGLNANYIPTMQKAIQNYISRINEHLNKIATETKTDGAMKGDYAIAVKAYIKAATDTCYKVVSQLSFFEDKLVSVREAYAQKDANLSGSINDSANEMENQWEAYKRQKN